MMDTATFNFYLTITLVAGTLFFLITLWVRQRKRIEYLEKQLFAVENKLHEQQLSELDYKLNPHLFKNVLNTIQSHAYQTYHSLDSLSSVLDYILYESKKKYVTPHQEIAFALSLIEIYRVKLSPLFELSIKKQIQDNEPLFNQRLMVPLISIDLIENAFKHADLQSPNSFISVTFIFKENTFSLTVANKVSSKTPLKKERQGVGSDLLTKRLDLLYRDNYKLDKFVEGDVYIAHLKIDLLEHKAKMLTAR
ncbi:histidine kinase [Sphingobacterium paludis]|uniref:Histidine kinase n=1 Tax=Sphingobacterium paludis TaxID=1476465 RepID=A0A4R7DAY0_9SPHI|nr:histidine kinase [Sphingobacterium paludis]TDS17421.1 histidine kinase [Sphingobacterium paludis]